MVQLTLTPHLSHAIGVYNALPNIGPPLPTCGHLSHQQIHELSRALLAAHPHKRQRYSFVRLLQGTEIFHAPAPAPAPKTAEYVALMARLRAEVEAASYAALVASPAEAEED
ncbi:hypothetical protein FN846DRAFT_902778 [Sphaerosporella brunnea]|uniref:Uncharacterized protein n=1 Tax=Sphaerosporella brunnea TaxID=1250544 RepID=A0A5J5F8C5_9PEZI|nr:hypothetical protein FN846DRAFT_902778 [Sphaerosporella brunnea]